MGISSRSLPLIIHNRPPGDLSNGLLEVYSIVLVDFLCMVKNTLRLLTK
jgi:hypothetical protein